MRGEISEIERMFNEIRIEIRKETRGMTPEERTEYHKKGTEEFIKECGYKKVPKGEGYILVDE